MPKKLDNNATEASPVEITVTDEGRKQDARVTVADGVNLRGWFLIYVGYLAVLTLAALSLISLAGQSMSPFAQKAWLLPLYLFYLSLCCTFFPAPTAWIVLLMASPMIGLIPPEMVVGALNVTAPAGQLLAAILTILMVAAIGALGTMMANLNEYHIFTFLLRNGRVGRIRQTRFYDRAARWFATGPFLLLVMISFIPMPVDVVRWLAITHRYPRGRYAGAYFLGRLVRYSLLAATATVLQIGWRGIVMIQGGLVLMLLAHLARRLLSRRNTDTMAVENLTPETEITP